MNLSRGNFAFKVSYFSAGDANEDVGPDLFNRHGVRRVLDAATCLADQFANRALCRPSAVRPDRL